MIKTIFRLLAVAISMLTVLAGCATQSPIEMAKQNGVATAPNQAEVNACLSWVQDKEDKKMAKFDSLKSDDKAYALMHHDTMDMIKDVFGKNKNECQPGTNVWDAYIAWVKEENATKREMVKEGGSTARFAAGVAGAAYTVTELAAKAGDRVFGDKNQAGRDNNQAGEGVSNSGTNTATDTRTQQTQVQAIRGNGNIEPATATAQTPAQPAASGTPTAAENPAATVPAP
ncbi:MAG: hypothetical protein ACOYB1_18640 [Limnohabitans sp.]